MKMKSILFVTENFYPDVSATGNCINNVASYYKKEGWDVTILSKKLDENWLDEEIYDGKKIYRITHKTFKNKIKIKLIVKLIDIIYKFLILYRWPIKSKDIIKCYCKKIIELNNEKDFDLIIFSINPPMSLIINYYLKKNNELLKKKYTVAYYLDALMNECHIKFLPKKLSNFKIFNLERKYLPFFNEVFFTDSHRSIYDIPKYDFIEKKHFLKLPSILIDYLYKEQDSIKSSDEYNLSYVGSISKLNRNPDKIFEFLTNVANDYKIKLNILFYGKLNNYNFKKFKDEYINIEYKGIVSKEEVYEIYEKTDFLINIDNINQTMIPSKIFEFISFKKPIINFTTYTESIIDTYLRDYDNYISIKYIDSNFEKEEERIYNFFEEGRCKRVDVDKIINSYSEYSPKTLFTMLNKEYE